MKLYNIFLLLIVFAIISLISGIFFRVLKSKNDEYVETQRILNPDFSNTYSETFYALMITSFILFGVSILSLIIFSSKKEIRIRLVTTPIYKKPLLLSYNDDTPNNTTTPDILKASSDVNKKIFERRRGKLNPLILNSSENSSENSSPKI